MKLRNFRDYCREIGVNGAIAILRQRKQQMEVFELPVRGIETSVFCRSNGSDFSALRQIFGRREVAVPFKQSPRFIVDAGANVGYASLLWANTWPGAMIVAIEPDVCNCDMFQRNCSKYPNIRLIRGALWHRSAALAITNPDAEPWAFQIGESQVGDSSKSVRAFTLAEIMTEFGVDRINLLKLDIEGSELELFSSGAEEWLRHVDCLMVELHDRIRPGCSAAFDRLLSSVQHTRQTSGEYECVRLNHT